ncbi:heme exporter protein CcmD [Aureimonas psammosilenae]|uniref:heme exporter protein CcmD n=1 Tax=Aureimonas psammosilenae TaxID=2495496 RepID=UPI0012607D06|nr:heme exporter protein CcmD [Aureimonas psammosilenae]
MNGGDYSAYVLSAYAISGLVLALLAAWIFAGTRAKRRELKRLEAGGHRRRSAGKTP